MIKSNHEPLISYVKALENKPSSARGLELERALQAMEINFFIQRWPFPRIKNFIVDFSFSSGGKKVIFAAHYDAVVATPGANDNASSVAVLLDLCRRLKERSPLTNVRIIFFDREEAWFRTNLLRLGLLGSLYYILRNKLSSTSAVYNLEGSGYGDLLAIWPVKNNTVNLSVLNKVNSAAERLHLQSRTASIPWILLSSDHLPFHLKGFTNAVTLSLIPADQQSAFEKLFATLSLPKLLTGRKPGLPEFLTDVHTPLDNSDRLTEISLKTMSNLIMEIIRLYENDDKEGKS